MIAKGEEWRVREWLNGPDDEDMEDRLMLGIWDEEKYRSFAFLGKAE